MHPRIKCGRHNLRARQKVQSTWAAGVLIALALSGCASLPPGSGFDKHPSIAYAHPETTRIGQTLGPAAQSHPDESAYRIISQGADGFATRVQMIAAAEHSLDLQYYIFHGDITGRLLTNALLVAADRGVHIRLLLDDGETVAGDEQIVALAAHPQIEIRIFNPFAYRGHSMVMRGLEFMVSSARLDYRMHNKLLVADGAAALIGGRNIGDAYFQIDSDAQYADDDVFAGGPIVQPLAATFDEYWNSARAIPVEALGGGKPTRSTLESLRLGLTQQLRQLSDDGVGYVQRAASGEPLEGMLSGDLPLVWAGARVVCDSPEKKRVASGSMAGRLMYEPVAAAASNAQTELLMITPYFVPTSAEMRLLHDLRLRHVRVRILTNSLESTNALLAHAAYARHRLQLLRDGVELYEVRALLGRSSKGSGQSVAVSRFGNYGLHAKLFVFDRRELFIGSMNFDQRSVRFNTEIGLIIDSPELAQETAARFEAMSQPASAYTVMLVGDESGHGRLLWHTMESGLPIDHSREPSPSLHRSVAVAFLGLLPIDKEL